MEENKLFDKDIDKMTKTELKETLITVIQFMNDRFKTITSQTDELFKIVDNLSEILKVKDIEREDLLKELNELRKIQDE